VDPRGSKGRRQGQGESYRASLHRKGFSPARPLWSTRLFGGIAAGPGAGDAIGRAGFPPGRPLGSTRFFGGSPAGPGAGDGNGRAALAPGFVGRTGPALEAAPAL